MSALSAMTPGKTAAVGALLVALGPVSMALYTPAMPTLVAVFGTDVSTVKLTLTLYFLGFAFAQLVCGPLSDAFGRRPAVLGFTSLYLVGCLIAMGAPTIEWLLVGRLVQGLGAAAGTAISRAIVRDLYSGRASVEVMNLIGLMLVVGPALSPTLGGATLGLFGWHAIFVVMTVYGVVILAAFRTIVPETLARRDPEAARPGRLATRYRALLADPRFLRPTIVMACSVGAIYALATFLPFVLIDEAGLTPLQFGMGMMAQSGSYLAGSAVMRRLLRTIEGRRLVPYGLVLVGLGAFLLPALAAITEPHFITVMGPIGLLAFGVAMVMPTMLTESLAPFPHMAGAAAALTGFFQMSAGLLGSAAAAAMGDPVLSLSVIVPVMATIAIVTYAALKRVTARMEAAANAAVEHPPAPAE